MARGNPTHARASREWTECPDCGQFQVLPAPRYGFNRLCARCGHGFGSGVALYSSWLAISSTALLILTVLYSTALLGIHIEGRQNTVSIADATRALFNQDAPGMGLFVLSLSVIMPIAHLLSQTIVLYCLWRDRRPQWLARLFKWSERIRPWAMLDVFLLALFITISKLREMSHVEIMPGLGALGALVALFCIFGFISDRQKIWDSIYSPSGPGETPSGENWIGCHTCNLMHRLGSEPERCPERCARCDTLLHVRKPNSVTRTWALIIAAFLLYIPANLYPVMIVVNFGRERPTTIMAGVRQLWTPSDWPYALLVFLASIIIPLFKLIGLCVFLLTYHCKHEAHLRLCTKLYRLFDKIGRWSILDVYVAATLGALVDFGNIASITPGPGLVPFAAVVVLTMEAVEKFDPRLMWDAAGEKANSLS